MSSIKNKNILHITAFDKGGAGISVLRIHKSLLKKGYNSKILVKKKFSNSKEVYSYAPKKIEKLKYYLNQIRKRVFLKTKKTDYFSDYRIGYDITKDPNFINADIIHLHWIAEFVDYKKLFENIKGKKLIWTVRDTNPFTGGCHCFRNCMKFKKKCGFCPQLSKNGKNDFSRETFNYKKQSYKKISKVICLSSWEKKELSDSSLMGNIPTEIISPGIPKELKKYNKHKARKYFKLPKNKFLIMFGSFSETPSKGFVYIKKATKLLEKYNSKIECITIGKNTTQDLPLKVISLGILTTYKELSLAYSAADVFIMPSLQETFGKMFAEAMKCGTVPICFNIGGTKDIIINYNNGFILKKKDYKKIAEKILFLLKNPQKKKKMEINAENKIKKYHTLEKEVKKIVKLYSNLFNSSFKKKNKISIITICYNAEDTIEKTITSVINQTYKNIEYIIVDGKSNDNTLKIIDKYKEHISKVISEKDKGIYDAMNKGIKEAYGQIIYFLNADDYLYNKQIIANVLAQFNKNSELDLVVGDILCKYKNEKELFKKIGKANLKDIKNGVMPPHQAAFVKTKWLRKFPFNLKYYSASDYDFFCNLIKRNIKYTKINQPIVVMKMDGYSTQNIKQSYKETEDIIKNHFGIWHYMKIIVIHRIYLLIKKIFYTLNIKKHKS